MNIIIYVKFPSSEKQYGYQLIRLDGAAVPSIGDKLCMYRGVTRRGPAYTKITVADLKWTPSIPEIVTSSLTIRGGSHQCTPGPLSVASPSPQVKQKQTSNFYNRYDLISWFMMGINTDKK